MYITGMNVTQVDDSPTYSLGQLGANGADGKIYKYLQYDTGAGSVAGVAGQVAYYGVTGHKTGVCTSDLSDSVEIGAGVLQSVMTDGQYGWFQIKGAATLSIALTAGNDGDLLTPSGATDGTLDTNASATTMVCAYAGDASANEITCDFPM